MQLIIAPITSQAFSMLLTDSAKATVKTKSSSNKVLKNINIRATSANLTVKWVILTRGQSGRNRSTECSAWSHLRSWTSEWCTRDPWAAIKATPIWPQLKRLIWAPPPRPIHSPRGRRQSNFWRLMLSQIWAVTPPSTTSTWPILNAHNLSVHNRPYLSIKLPSHRFPNRACRWSKISQSMLVQQLQK